MNECQRSSARRCQIKDKGDEMKEVRRGGERMIKREREESDRGK